MSIIKHLALTVEKSGLVSVSDLTKVAAALQKQVARDFAPIWNIHATISAFAHLEDVPIGYWPLIVAEVVEGAAGYHEDKDGQPFSLIAVGDSWSLTASHECLEMLADPFGKRIIAGESPKKGQGRVEFLVEVCDPSEDEKYAYTVNGVLVSDFYTPRYFDPVKSTGVQYSFGGAITAPRQVLPGGYLSWHDPKDDQWWQLTYFGKKPVVKSLGKFDNKFKNFRSFIDFHTPQLYRLSGLGNKTAGMKLLLASRASTSKSTNVKATQWRQQIASLRKATKTSSK
jgi:hypothetical protein